MSKNSDVLQTCADFRVGKCNFTHNVRTLKPNGTNLNGSQKREIRDSLNLKRQLHRNRLL